MILWRQPERTQGESSHGFLSRCTTCTHKNSVTCMNTRLIVNCGVREGNWRPAYCLSKAWGIVEAHGHFYDLGLHMHKDSCSVLQNLDTVRRLKSDPSKHRTVKPKTFQEALQTVHPLSLQSVQHLSANSAPWMWPLVELVWALVVFCFWELRTKTF